MALMRQRERETAASEQPRCLRQTYRRTDRHGCGGREEREREREDVGDLMPISSHRRRLSVVGGLLCARSRWVRFSGFRAEHVTAPTRPYIIF